MLSCGLGYGYTSNIILATATRTMVIKSLRYLGEEKIDRLSCLAVVVQRLGGNFACVAFARVGEEYNGDVRPNKNCDIKNSSQLY